MEIEKIEKVGFLSATFSTLKEDIPKSIEKEEWTDMLPIGCRAEEIEIFEPQRMKR